MHIQEKIDKILKHNRLHIKSIFGLEKFSRVGIGSISKPLKNGATPSLGTIKKIQDALFINNEWWETGKGEIFIVGKTEELKVENDPQTEWLTERGNLYKKIVELQEHIMKLQKELDEYKTDELKRTNDSLKNIDTIHTVQLQRLTEEPPISPVER